MCIVCVRKRADKGGGFSSREREREQKETDDERTDWSTTFDWKKDNRG